VPDWIATMLVMVGALGLQVAHTVWTDRRLPKNLHKLPLCFQSWPQPTRLTRRRESLWFFACLFALILVMTGWTLTEPGRPLLPAAIIVAVIFTALHTAWMIRLRLWARTNSSRRAASVQVNSG